MISNPALLLVIGMAANSPAPPDCSDAPHRQFDFWVGEWTVTMIDKEGKRVLAGHNSVRRDLKDCVITEHWRGSRGTDGRSLNLYDRQTQQWKQFWVDNQGGLLELHGSSPKPNEMLMQSQPLNGVIQRIHWQKLENGSVRQLWTSSSDNGATWTTAFDGLYSQTAEQHD